jgi:hypothetical protein
MNNHSTNYIDTINSDYLGKISQLATVKITVGRSILPWFLPLFTEEMQEIKEFQFPFQNLHFKFGLWISI